VNEKPDHISVAAAAYPLDPAQSLAAWAAKAERWVADGAATAARLLVFPEYGALELAATRGKAVTSDLGATLAAVADLQAESEATWRLLAGRYGVYILAPSGPERRAYGFVNAARLYAPGGAVGVQEKLIMTPFERGWGISAGKVQRVFDTGIGQLGVAICYDSEFPLLVRALAEARADLVLVPSCTEHPSGYNRVRTAALARALESQIATIMSPTVGAATWSTAIDQNYGAAGIFVPSDVSLSLTGVLAEGTPNVPGWTSATIDLSGLAWLREAGEMRNCRDWDLQAGAHPLSADVEVVRLD
jgi:predicted amidohydrolase